MKEEGLKIVEEKNKLLEFLKKEKKERSIKESLRHEDFIYFTFLISLALIIISTQIPTDLTYSGQENSADPMEILLALMEKILNLTSYLVVLFIVFFAFIRFVGIVFESKLLRYISLHGLFCSFVSMALIFLYILVLAVISVKFLPPPSPIEEIIIGCIIVLPSIFLLAVFLMRCYRSVKEKLFETKKYISLRKEYGEIIDDLLPMFYLSFVLPILSILFFIDSYMSNEPIELCKLFLLIMLFIVGILCGFGFYIIKKRHNEV